MGCRTHHPRTRARSSVRPRCRAPVGGSCTRRSRPATPTPRTAAATDWLQVLVLYDMLLRFDRSPIVRLNRAVALAEVRGADVALAEVERLAGPLSGYHLWHAVRAELLTREGRAEEAMVEDLRALELTANEAERRLLAARLSRPGARVSACATSRSIVVMPSRDRIDSRCPCTDAKPGPRRA